MAADATLEIQLKTVAELKSLREAVNELTAVKKAATEAQSALSGSFGGFTKAIKGIPLAIGAVTGAVAGLVGSFSLVFDAIKEAQEAERNLQQLTAALETTGEATRENIAAFEAFAAQIESTTRFGDDLIIQQLAIAKNFGLTTVEAKKLVEAATDLSAVTGNDLTKSTEDLLKTLTGQTPKELRILGLEFANLTKEQLKAGAALDLVASKFGDRAEKEVTTLSGSLTQLGNTFSNVLEGFGKTATESTLLGQSISFLTQQLRIFGGLETDEQKLKRLQEEATKAQGALRNLGIKKEIIELEARINGKKLSEAGAEIDSAINAAKAFRSPLQIEVSLDQEKIKKVVEDYSKLGLTTLELARKERDERIKILNEAFGGESNLAKLSADNAKLYANTKLRIEKELNSKVAQERDKAIKEEQDALRKRQQIFKEAAGNLGKSFFEIFKGSKDRDLLAGAGLGVAQNVVQGGAGARSLLGQGAVGAGFALGGTAGGEIGQAVAPIITELAKGKEAAKAFVTEFLQSIPDMVFGLVDGIIAAGQAFVEQVPLIIQRFVEGIPQLIDSLAKSMPEVATALAIQMPVVAVTFASSLVEQAPAIAEALIKAIPNAVGGGISGIGKALRFAEGGSGFVKSVPGGFSNDTFPARLTSGELVVDRSTAYKLKEFLSSQKSESQRPERRGETRNVVQDLADIVINIDGREIARAVRRQQRTGMVI